MSFCKVVNDNVHPFRQEFKEQMISIPAGGSISMDRDDAVIFLGSFFPPKKDGNDQPDPKFFKKLRIVDLVGTPSDIVEESFVCQKCRHKASSKEELDQHIDEMHLEDLADTEFKEQREEEIAKRGRGRPPGAKNKE
jgi:hypothetical protein